MNKTRIELAERFRELGRGDSFDTDAHDAAALALWGTFKHAHIDVFNQLMKKPTWDGDIVSKSARDDLIDCGLAVRCCVNFEQGYTTATYLSGSLWRLVKGARV